MVEFDRHPCYTLAYQVFLLIPQLEGGYMLETVASAAVLAFGSLA